MGGTPVQHHHAHPAEGEAHEKRGDVEPIRAFERVRQRAQEVGVGGRFGGDQVIGTARPLLVKQEADGAHLVRDVDPGQGLPSTPQSSAKEESGGKFHQFQDGAVA